MIGQRTLTAIALVLVVSASGVAQINVDGEWEVQVNIEGNSGPAPTGTLTFQQDGEQLSGIITASGDVPLGLPDVAFEGTISGNEIELSVEAEFQGQQFEIVLGAVVNGDEMTGSFDMGGGFRVDWIASRVQQ